MTTRTAGRVAVDHESRFVSGCDVAFGPPSAMLADRVCLPLDAHPVDGGDVFILVYGARCDWACNTLAAGHARLSIDGQQIELASPHLMTGEKAWQAIGDGAKRPPGVLRITEYRRMDVADR